MHAHIDFGGTSSSTEGTISRHSRTGTRCGIDTGCPPPSSLWLQMMYMLITNGHPLNLSENPSRPVLTQPVPSPSPTCLGLPCVALIRAGVTCLMFICSLGVPGTRERAVSRLWLTISSCAWGIGGDRALIPRVASREDWLPVAAHRSLRRRARSRRSKQNYAQPHFLAYCQRGQQDRPRRQLSL